MAHQEQQRAPIPGSFADKKARIVAQLTVPESAYADASPKGSVDAGIRDLIGDINAVAGLVTTSSCAGRVSVFLEGRRGAEGVGGAAAGAVGGKGGGGRWLFVSHEPLDRAPRCGGWDGVLFGGEAPGGSGGGAPRSRDGEVEVGEERGDEEVAEEDEEEERLVHFKFEPMILHVLAASTQHAQSVVRCGLEAGFRESGAINIAAGGAQQAATPMVAVRSMGLGLESIVGVRTASGAVRRLVGPEYLAMLVRVANERFRQNAARIQRFRAAMAAEFATTIPGPVSGSNGSSWEDAEERRERKRAEGLRRRAEVAAERDRIREKQKDVDVSEELPSLVLQ